MEKYVDVAPGIQLYARLDGPAGRPVVLLVAGANAAGSSWPDGLVSQLTRHHRVLRYDHRDTGRSTRVFDRDPYPVTVLATDAVAVLDAFGISRAIVVGTSLGAQLTQLLLLDAADRVASAVLLCAAALPMPDARQSDHPGPSPALARVWRGLAEARDPAEVVEWKVEQWRLLNGPRLPFAENAYRRLERRAAAARGPAGPLLGPHVRADPGRLARRPELARVRVPTLVLEGSCDPVNPPPCAAILTASIPTSRRVTLADMAHLIHPLVAPQIAAQVAGFVSPAGHRFGPPPT